MADIARLIRAVVFDVGETLVDETRAWSAHADAAGLTRLTLFAALGALIERGEDHRSVWALLGVDAPTDVIEIVVDAPTDVIEIVATDLYPDVIPGLRALTASGVRVGLAGNQPARAEPALAALGLPISFTASSARWGVEKPHPEFFERVVAEADVPARQLAYVGDRLDNDVLPARRAGMVAVFIRRGPWGYLHAHRPEVSQADARIDTLGRASRAARDQSRRGCLAHRGIGCLPPATQWLLDDRSGGVPDASEDARPRAEPRPQVVVAMVCVSAATAR